MSSTYEHDPEGGIPGGYHDSGGLCNGPGGTFAMKPVTLMASAYGLCYDPGVNAFPALHENSDTIQEGTPVKGS